jgi:hypothetical protein
LEAGVFDKCRGGNGRYKKINRTNNGKNGEFSGRNLTYPAVKNNRKNY